MHDHIPPQRYKARSHGDAWPQPQRRAAEPCRGRAAAGAIGRER
jgi:hypothetical protein